MGLGRAAVELALVTRVDTAVEQDSCRCTRTPNRGSSETRTDGGTQFSTGVEGEAALVTGAASGIGEATAEALADGGVRVALAARRRDELQAVADRIEAEGDEVFAIPTDVTDVAQVEAMIDTTVEEFGRLDVLVNNAGVVLLEPLIEADTVNLRQMVEVNLLELMNATHATLPILHEQGSGHIVDVSSVAGREASQTASGYNATKSASAASPKPSARRSPTKESASR